MYVCEIISEKIPHYTRGTCYLNPMPPKKKLFISILHDFKAYTLKLARYLTVNGFSIHTIISILRALTGSSLTLFFKKKAKSTTVIMFVKNEGVLLSLKLYFAVY